MYRDGVEIEEDIIEYVAKNIKTNVRELEGAIISLIAQSSFNKAAITLDLAKEVVMKFVKKHQTRSIHRLHPKSCFRLLPNGC